MLGRLNVHHITTQGRQAAGYPPYLITFAKVTAHKRRHTRLIAQTRSPSPSYPEFHGYVYEEEMDNLRRKFKLI